jgi:hypothetical protein
MKVIGVRVMDWIIANIDSLVDIIAKVVAVAAALSALTPSEVDNKVMVYVMKVVDVLGMNVLHAKNSK